MDISDVSRSPFPPPQIRTEIYSILCWFLAKLFPQLCSCNWNGNCDLFSDYERQKGHNFPILWPFQELWTTERSQFPNFMTFSEIMNDKRSQFSDYEWHCERQKGSQFCERQNLNGLQEFFGIIFSLFQWEILFSHTFAPLFCSFHYNRKWLHFEFHLISGIWRCRMCFLWLLSFIKRSQLWPF